MKKPIFAYECSSAFGIQYGYYAYIVICDNGDLFDGTLYDQKPIIYKLKTETVDKIVAIIEKDYDAIKQIDEVIDNGTLDGVENTFLFLDKEITDFNIEVENLDCEKLILKVFGEIADVLKEEGYHLTLDKFWVDNNKISLENEEE